MTPYAVGVTGVPAALGAAVCVRCNIDSCHVLCRGLTSETGQNNCFLNVIIQSLWHLASFREALLGTDPAAVPAPGAPPADARVLTALRNIFRAFQQVCHGTACSVGPVGMSCRAAQHLPGLAEGQQVRLTGLSPFS